MAVMPIPDHIVHARRVLTMVAELHVRGDQRLRAFPYMSASGMHWRCLVVPATAISANNGTTLVDGADHLGVTYSSSERAHPFGWEDAGASTASGLARRFLERFPLVCAAGQGQDWLYAGWHSWMLHLTYPALIPFVFADWDVDLSLGLPATGASDVKEVRIPVPPPGEGRLASPAQG